MNDQTGTTEMVVAEQRPPKAPLVAGHIPKPIVPQDFDGAWRIGNAVAGAGMAPRGLETPEKCTIAILHGLEVGLPPMQALQSISVINGRPSLWGDGALGLIQSSGLLEDQDEHFEGEPGTDSYRAVCILKRKGKSRPFKVEFSIADAKAAGLWTKRGRNGEPTPWQTYAPRMLKMRARAWAMRDGFSDVLKGLSIGEEQQDVERMAVADAPTAKAPPPPELRAPPPPAEETAAEETAAEQTEATAEDAEFEEQEQIDREQSMPKHDDPITTGPQNVEPATVVEDDGFPGDKPLPKKPVTMQSSSSDPLEIPWRLDARLSEHDREWLLSLDEAWQQCHDVEEIAAEQESIMAPAKDSLSPYAWKKGCDLMDKHIERVTSRGR